MLKTFMSVIDEIFNIINEPIDSIYKYIAINNYRKFLLMEDSITFGQNYYNMLKDNKSSGVVYTPEEISNYIISNTLSEKDIIQNPFIKILDPACGTGNFLIPLYKYLFEIYMDNMEMINITHNLLLTKENINKHIIDNNIFGFDIDEISIKTLYIDLFLLSGYMNIQNVEKCDFLLDKVKESFDIVIGNPPYVGHKTVDRQYAITLKNAYGSIYKDKSDIAYCFFVKSLNCLKKSGKLSFITSRYFLESPSGEELRKFIINSCTIDRIVDFYGIRPFKGIGIDPAIIFINKNKNRNYDIDIIKPKAKVLDGGKNFLYSLYNNTDKEYRRFLISSNQLSNKGWVLRDKISMNIINKIEKKCSTNLLNICESNQGIITGCDKAFVLTMNEIEDNNIEKELIKPWIKSSYIEKYEVGFKDKYLIYSNNIYNEEDYPESIRFIGNYKDKLLNRRECIKGIRKWYELQWGRKPEVFEGEKIIYPYKASNNRFALDKGSYFSADIYCFKLKDKVSFTYDFLLKVLNSNVYEYYYKSFAKKLGDNLYEYYPNNVMKLCIPSMYNFNYENENWLYDYFQLDDYEIELIKMEIE